MPLTKPQIEEITNRFSNKTLRKGSRVYMSSDSGIEGYGNIQCVESICEPLGTLSLYGQNLNPKTYEIREVLPNQVMLGDILEKDKKNIADGKISMGLGGLTELLDLLDECGYTKSLEEIAESGWEEEKCSICHGASPLIGTCPHLKSKVLKPEVNALFEFLDKLSANPKQP